MWLKIETHTINKPEVFAMSASLGVSRAEVVGHLVTVWAWFDQNTEDGCVESAHGSAIVDGMTVPNFADAMQAVGWLNATESKLCLPNFGKHNGSTAKKRANGQARQSRFRNAPSVTREEKIREEKKKTSRVITPYQKVVDAWNLAAKETPCPTAEKLTAKRKAAIKQICVDYTVEQIAEVFTKCCALPYMRGENQHGWIADLDYILRPEKFIRIFESGSGTASTSGGADFNEWNK